MTLKTTVQRDWSEERVDDFGTGEDVETDKHDVVSEEHEAGEFVCDLRFSEGVVAEVANVPDLGVLYDEAVHCDGSDLGYANQPTSG